MLSYLNFDLLIARAGGAYRVYVVDAPGGDATSTFTLPFSPQEIERLHLGFGIRHIGQVHEQASNPLSLRDLGQRLFAAVFQDEVYSVLIASQTVAKVAGSNLRIRLRFSEDAIALAKLPWEILFDPNQQLFLALSESMPILRYLSLPRPRPALVVRPPLTILTVLASPTDHSTLNVEQEWQAIETALANLRADKKVTLERLEMPTLTALRERLLGEPVHVLHFVGHGIYDEGQGEGQLLFENAQHKSHWVSAQSLAMVLHNHSSLRLVYLNACEGAISDQGNAFTGVAQTLVQQGVPAAVAMQNEITDAAAIELARTFYAALATGRPVDIALTQSRVALATNANDEWVIPVLFSRSPDNRLFDMVDVLPTPECPYPGMVHFTEKQANLFFGRNTEITEASEHLRLYPFLTIIGPSGSGKSSLVYAGIIPALGHSKRFGAGEWKVKVMRPGETPASTLAQLLETSPNALSSISCEKRMLLFIDQFEELFTLVSTRWDKTNRLLKDRQAIDETQTFLDALASLIGQPNLYIILTVRADFYSDLMASPLWPSIKAHRLEVTTLDENSLWTAMVEPAAQVGVIVDDALAVRLIADAAGQAGVLPLVQETLILLWEKVERRHLKLQAYQEMAEGNRSGIQVAISRRADVVYNNLMDNAKSIARRIFLRLIQFGEGRADTRRQQAVQDLLTSSDLLPLFTQTLDKLTDSRLLTMSGGESDPARMVDIAHEALISGWPTLGGWIVQRREAEQVRRRLESKAMEWSRLGRDIGGLLDEVELLEAERWLSSADADELGASQILLSLVSKSRAVSDEIKRAREDAQQHEIETARRLAEEADARRAAETQSRIEAEQRVAEQEKTNKELSRRLYYTIGALTLAMILGIVAIFFEMRSSQNAAITLARQLSAQAQVITIKSDPVLNTLLGIEGLRRLEDANESNLFDSMQALRLAMNLLPRRMVQLFQDRNVIDLEFTPDSQMLMTLNREGIVDVIDLKTGMISQQLQHSEAGTDLAISPNGGWLAARGKQYISIWKLPDGQKFYEFRHPWNWNSVIRLPSTLVFSPDGKQLAAVGDNGIIHIWDVVSGVEAITIYHDSVDSVAFSPDNRHIVTTGGSKARLWSIESNSAVLVSETNEPERVIKFSQAGDKIIFTGPVWNHDLTKSLYTLGQNYSRGWLNVVSISADDKYIGFGYGEAIGTHPAEVVDLSNGLLKARVLHDVQVSSIDFGLPRNNFFLSTGWDGVGKISNIGDSSESVRVVHKTSISIGAISQDGHWAATAGEEDGGLYIWQPKAGIESKSIELNGIFLGVTTDKQLVVVSDNNLSTVKLSADKVEDVQVDNHLFLGSKVLFSNEDISTKIIDSLAFIEGDLAKVYNFNTDTLVTEVFHPGANQVHLSPDNQHMVTIREDRGYGTAQANIRLWEIPSGTELSTISHPNAQQILFSPTGTYFVTNNRHDAIIWDSFSGKEIMKVTDPDNQLGNVTFFPHEQRFALYRNKFVEIWNISTAKMEKKIAEDSYLHIIFSSSGNLAVFNPDNGDLTVRRTKSIDEVLMRIPYHRSAWDIAFSPDEHWLAIVHGDQVASVWDIDSGHLVAEVTHESLISNVFFNPDGSQLITYSLEDNLLRTWALTPNKLINEACERLPRNLTLEEWKNYFGEEPYRCTCTTLPQHSSLINASIPIAKHTCSVTR